MKSAVEICPTHGMRISAALLLQTACKPSASLLGFWFVCKGLWKSELRRRALVGHFRVYLDKITCKKKHEETLVLFLRV